MSSSNHSNPFDFGHTLAEMVLLKGILAVTQEMVSLTVAVAATQDLATPVMTASTFERVEVVWQPHCFHSQGYRCLWADQVDSQLVGSTTARGPACVEHSAGGLVSQVTTVWELAEALVVMSLSPLSHSLPFHNWAVEYLGLSRPARVSGPQCDPQWSWELVRPPCRRKPGGGDFRKQRLNPTTRLKSQKL